MSVEAGFVGSSAKLETGKEWMSEARKELRLTSNGWMSEMVGKSTEVVFINTVNRTQATIHEIMGSPTETTVYVFENTATISAATQGGWALQTGAFPAGSTLKIINRGDIRGGGGNSTTKDGQKGGDALILDFPAHIDNTQGYIYGGGGGGGSVTVESRIKTGGGGAGTPAGVAPNISGNIHTGKNGTATTGGAGVVDGQYRSGNGGGLGRAGSNAVSDNPVLANKGGAAGRAVVRNGHAVTWLGGDTAPNVYGPVV